MSIYMYMITGEEWVFERFTNVEVFLSTATSTEWRVEQVGARFVERQKRGRVERQSYTEGSSVALKPKSLNVRGEKFKEEKRRGKEIYLEKLIHCCHEAANGGSAGVRMWPNKQAPHFCLR